MFKKIFIFTKTIKPKKLLVYVFLFFLILTLPKTLMLICEYSLYRRVASGNFHYTNAFPGFVFNSQTSMKNTYQKIINRHKELVVNEDGRTGIIILPEYSERLSLWNGLLEYYRRICEPESKKAIEEYLIAHAKSRSIRRDEFDNLQVLIQANFPEDKNLKNECQYLSPAFGVPVQGVRSEPESPTTEPDS